MVQRSCLCSTPGDLRINCEGDSCMVLSCIWCCLASGVVLHLLLSCIWCCIASELLGQLCAIPSLATHVRKSHTQHWG